MFWTISAINLRTPPPIEALLRRFFIDIKLCFRSFRVSLTYPASSSSLEVFWRISRPRFDSSDSNQQNPYHNLKPLKCVYLPLYFESVGEIGNGNLLMSGKFVRACSFYFRHFVVVGINNLTCAKRMLYKLHFYYLNSCVRWISYPHHLIYVEWLIYTFCK